MFLYLHLIKSLQCYIRYTVPCFLFYTYLYYLLLNSQEKLLVYLGRGSKTQTPVCEHLNMCENLGSHSGDYLDKSFGMFRRLVW